MKEKLIENLSYQICPECGCKEIEIDNWGMFPEDRDWFYYCKDCDATFYLKDERAKGE